MYMHVEVLLSIILRVIFLIFLHFEKGQGTIHQVSRPGTHQTCFPDRVKGRIMFILKLSNHLGATDSSVMTKYGLPSCWKTNGFSINESLSFTE